jgi:hypothetical protein
VEKRRTRVLLASAGCTTFIAAPARQSGMASHLYPEYHAISRYPTCFHMMNAQLSWSSAAQRATKRATPWTHQPNSGTISLTKPRPIFTLCCVCHPLVTHSGAQLHREFVNKFVKTSLRSSLRVHLGNLGRPAFCAMHVTHRVCSELRSLKVVLMKGFICLWLDTLLQHQDQAYTVGVTAANEPPPSGSHPSCLGPPHSLHIRRLHFLSCCFKFLLKMELHFCPTCSGSRK